MTRHSLSPQRPPPDSLTFTLILASHWSPESSALLPLLSQTPWLSRLMNSPSLNHRHTHAHVYVIDDVTRQSLETLKAINNKKFNRSPSNHFHSGISATGNRSSDAYLLFISCKLLNACKIKICN